LDDAKSSDVEMLLQNGAMAQWHAGQVLSGKGS
jgi:hypothetical protein